MPEHQNGNGVKAVVGRHQRPASRDNKSQRRKKKRNVLPGESPLARGDFQGWLTRASSYGGYNEQMINRFVLMGFDLDRVVNAFEFVGIDPNDGEDYPLEEAYIGDITARLLGEP